MRYKLRFDKNAIKVYQKAEINLVQRLNRCFENLGQNPFIHPNIKRLKGTLAGLYRYRVGEWRIIYNIIELEKVVNIFEFWKYSA